MKIYAIKDRLIGYFLVPFIAPSDKEIMAGISHEINRPDNYAAIAQSPHHFEIYTLGEIDDEGNITVRKEFICDCGSLIRTGRDSTESTTGATPGTPRESANGTLRNRGDSGAYNQSLSKGEKIEHQPS